MQAKIYNQFKLQLFFCDLMQIKEEFYVFSTMSMIKCDKNYEIVYGVDYFSIKDIQVDEDKVLIIFTKLSICGARI